MSVTVSFDRQPCMVTDQYLSAINIKARVVNSEAARREEPATRPMWLPEEGEKEE